MGNKILKKGNIKKTVNYIKRNGIRRAFYAVKERVAEEKTTDYYYSAPTKEILTAQHKEMESMPYLFSIIVPVYEPKEDFFREMIASVLGQSYSKWELILADAGNSGLARRVVDHVVRETGDARIKYKRLAENKGISENTNAGIALAAGDYIALLDYDDILAPDALYYLAVTLHHSLQQGIRPALIYTDEDKYESDARCYKYPHRKQKFNLDLILSNNYICHFMAVETNLMRNLQLRGQYDGAQDYDLVLRVVGELLKETPALELEKNIVHIPQILYHWRCHSDSTAENTESKSYAYTAGKAALSDFCKTQGWEAVVENSLHLGFYNIIYATDILDIRQDVGVVGGRILNRRSRICAGMYDENGKLLFAGLPKEYTGGSTHRAALMQDCAAVDIRCIRVKDELRELFREITGLSYCEKFVKNTADGQLMRIADVSGLQCDEEGYRKLSMTLCRAVNARGFQIVWNPGMALKDNSV